MKSWKQKLTAILLAAGMSLSTAACGLFPNQPLIAKQVSLSGDLMKEIQPEAPSGKPADASFTKAQTAFALNLLQKTAEKSNGENLALSPYSLMQALAMTVNGAEGKTKTEMLHVLGDLPLDDLNEYLYQYRTGQPQQQNTQVLTANSVWYPDDEQMFHVSTDYLKTISGYYAADAYQRPFNDDTVKDINKWVDAKTAHMIPDIIKEITPVTRMYLFNATVFEGKWETGYKKGEIEDGPFYAADGTVQVVPMMHSKEHFVIKDTNAKGFLKMYQGGRYAFAALLPDQGIPVAEYAASLTPDRLEALFSGRQSATVQVTMPKFTTDYSSDLTEVLKDMGMGEAFGASADFSRMNADGEPLLYINSVLHKIHIEVDENGTRAAAVSGTKLDGSAAEPERIVVTLDRPFLYCILDLETNLPVFIGIMQSVS